MINLNYLKSDRHLMVGRKSHRPMMTAPTRGVFGLILSLVFVGTLTLINDSGVAHATPAIVNETGMICATDGIAVFAPDAYSTTRNLYWIAQVHAWNGSSTDIVGYGDWQVKSNTGSLYTNWTNTRTGAASTFDSISFNPGYWYAVRVWVYSNDDWFSYWAQTDVGGYWC